MAANDTHAPPESDLHLVAGVLTKVYRFKRGQRAPQHAHAHEHLSMVCQGFVELSVEGEDSRELGPGQCVTIAAGKEHWVHAHTDATWCCIWNADHYPLPDEVTA